MSTAIDNRIVQMQFNNSQFESAARQSIGTLGDLKSALKLDNIADSLSSLSSTVGGIADKFTFFGQIGAKVMNEMTDLVMNLTNKITGMVNELTISQVNAGWDKYADKTTAVQTIMSATASQFSDTATQMAYVNSQLDKLNWYTDETSYNFVDMTSNIGKFTSSGVQLDTAVTAMEGIANWAAASGQNAATASRAMYNLAQAISVGSVKLVDWKSIENANMATVEFKETALETAVSLGTLTKTADGLYKTAKGTTVTVEDFNSALSEGWFSSEVLLDSLGKYGGLTDQLYELAQTEEFAGKTTSEIIEILESQGRLTDEFGLKVFKMAQEAKTFADAIDSVKDAASTGWMNIFETIFGDYMQAKVVWTDLANYLYDVFVSPLEAVQETLDEWVSLGGRFTLFNNDESLGDLGAFYKIGDTIASWVQPIKNAWSYIFEPITGGTLLKLTQGFSNLVDKFKMSIQTTSQLTRIFSGLFSIFQIGAKTVKSVLNVILPLNSSISDLITRILGKIANVADYITKFNKSFDGLSEDSIVIRGLSKAVELLKKAFDGINFDNITGKIKNLFVSIRDLISSRLKVDLTSFSSAWESIKNAISGVAGKFDLTAVSIENLKNKVHPLTTALNAVKTAISWVGDKLSYLWNLIKQAVGSLDITAGGVLKMSVAFAVLKKALTSGGNPINEFFKTLKSGFKNISKNVSEALGSISDAISSFSLGNKTKALKTVASSLLMLAAALVALSLVNPDALAVSLFVLAVGLGELVGAMALISNIDSTKGTAGILALAGAMLLLSVAMKIFATMSYTDILTSFVAMGSGLILLVAALGILSKMEGSILAAGASLLIAASAMIVLAGAVTLFALAVKIPGFWEGLGAMAASLVVLSTALLALSLAGAKSLAAAGALLIAAAAIAVLAASLIALSLADPDKVAKSMETLVLGMAGLAAIVGILSLFGPATLIAAGALLAISAAALIGAGSILLASKAINSLDGVDWWTMAKGMFEVTAGMGALTVAGIALIAGLVGLAGAASSMNSFAKSIEKCEKYFGSFLTQLDSFTTSTGTFASNASQVKSSVESMMDSIKTSCNNIISTLKSTGNNMASSLVSGIKNGSGSAYSAGTSLSSNAYNGANAYTGWFYSIGQNIAIGMSNGIYGEAWRVRDAANYLGSIANNATRSATGVHSPSRVFMGIGKFLDMGLAIGITNNTDVVENAAEALAFDAIAAITDAIESDIDTAPTITPVLDLSNVTANASKLGDLLDTTEAFNASAAISGNLSRIQNAGSEGTMVVTLDANSLSALTKAQSMKTDVNVNFTGKLSQLAAVLQPAIVAETNRLGPSLIKG